MPKLFISVSHTAEGTKGLIRECRQRRLLATVATISLALTFAPQGPLKAQEPPQRSVFVVVVIARAFQGPFKGGYQSVGRGTAFFISSDGRALTSSHVVYRVRTDRTYRLLAVVGKEFYSASLTCASELPYDPTQQRTTVPFSRDVAEIRLTPPDFPSDQLVYNGYPIALAHRGPLPAFPALALAPAPQVGDSVRVLGYGAVSTQPVPYEWSAEGTVTRTMEFTDGTPGFKITFASRPAIPGHSGSPVLNTLGQVVGLWDWHDHQDLQIGTAISSTALEPACVPQELKTIQLLSLGPVRLIRAILTHDVTSGTPSDETKEFKSGDKFYAYVAIRFRQPLTVDQMSGHSTIQWRWTAPSGEVLETKQSTDFLKEGWTQVSVWSRIPSFEGKVQQPVGEWSVECLWQDVSVTRMTFTLAQ